MLLLRRVQIFVLLLLLLRRIIERRIVLYRQISTRILYIVPVCYLKTFISYYMFYRLHVVEPLRYDSVLIKETNE